MKKLTLGLAVLLAGFAANSLAGIPTGTSRCDVSVPSYCGGFTFGLTGLWWRATSPQQDFGLTYDDVGLTLPFVGSGDVHDHNHHHDYDWGFKANVGYIFPCSGNDVNLTYTHWDNDHHTHVDDADFRPTAGDFALILDPLTGPVLPFVGVESGDAFPALLPLFNLISADGFDLTALNSRISAKSDFENHTWDLDFGQAINVGCNFRMRWFGGLRYSHLENKLDTAFETTLVGGGDAIVIDSTDLIPLTDATLTGSTTLEDDLTVVVTDFFRNRSKFNGIGPRFGFDVSYNFCGGFGVVGSLSTSLLVGEVDSSFGERVTLAGTFAAVSTSSPSGITATTSESGTEGTDLDPFVSEFTTDTDWVSFHHPDETRVVPNIDAKLGLDYTYQFCNCSRSKLTVEAGYQVSHYFNAIDRLTDFGFADANFGERRTLDLSYDGPYVSVQVAL